MFLRYENSDGVTVYLNLDNVAFVSWPAIEEGRPLTVTFQMVGETPTVYLKEATPEFVRNLEFILAEHGRGLKS